MAVAVAVDAIGREVPGAQAVAGTSSLEMSEVVSRLGRLNEHFRQLWSPVCYEQQSWLGHYFTVLVERVRDHEGEYVAELADMAMGRAADDVRPGFIAKQSAAASLNRVFAQPRSSYKRVNSKPHPLSFALRAMSALKGSVAPAFGAVIHPSAALGFKNFTEVTRGLRPRQFQLAAYKQALEQTHIEGAHQLDDVHFLPKEGELLGPLHLAHAWCDLERGFATARLMPSSRKVAAIALARLVSRHHATFDQTVPPGLRGQRLVLNVRRPIAEELDEVEQVTHEHTTQVATACALLAWHLRMEGKRRPKALLTQIRA